MSSIVGSAIGGSVTLHDRPHDRARAGSVGVVRRPSAAELMALVTVGLWALNFTVTRYVLTHGFEPLAYATVRYGAAALIVAVLVLVLEGSLAVRRSDLPLLLLAAVLGIWLNQIAFTEALARTTASTGALVMGSLPIFTALIAAAVGVERLTPRFVAAGAVSFAGVALVALGATGGLSGDTTGNLIMVATAATWAGYTVAIAPLMRRYSPVRISAFVLLAGWLPLVVTGLPHLARQDWGLTPQVWALLAFAVLGPLVLTNVLWFTVIDRIGPSRATLFTNLQPFLAAVLGLVLLSERMTLLQLVGGLLIALGIGLARRRWRRVPVAEATAGVRSGP
jgi:drug/metabolite transporter (DMT)-like permease